MPRKNGGIRTVVFLSRENYLAIHAAIMPKDGSKTKHGALSDLVNGTLDQWRVRRAERTEVARLEGQIPTEGEHA